MHRIKYPVNVLRSTCTTKLRGNHNSVNSLLCHLLSHRPRRRIISWVQLEMCCYISPNQEDSTAFHHVPNYFIALRLNRTVCVARYRRWPLVGFNKCEESESCCTGYTISIFTSLLICLIGKSYNRDYHIT